MNIEAFLSSLTFNVFIDEGRLSLSDVTFPTTYWSIFLAIYFISSLKFILKDSKKENPFKLIV